METDNSRTFSPSKLGTYKDCPRRYRYRYVDKIKRDAKSIEAFLGTCVHKALEELYRGVSHGRVMSGEELAGIFEKEWGDGWSDKIVIHDARYSPEDWKNVGRQCLQSYYEAHKPFDEDATAGLEKKIGFALSADGQDYRIEGFIDRLAVAKDGAFEIHDYKTGASLPAQEQLDADWQLALYDAAVRHAWPDAREVRLVWHYLRHGKTLLSRRSPEQLEALKSEVAGEILAIKADAEFAPRESALCRWCEYRDLCPLWAHAEKIKSLPAAAEKDDGLKLVDELAVLEGRKKEIKSDLEAVERQRETVAQAIIRFAQAQGLSAVFGTEGQAALSEKEEYKFPVRTHSPEAFAALEKELRESPLWKEVSRLDTHLLLEGYKRKEWPVALLSLVQDVVERYAVRSRETTLRFKRRKSAEED